MLAVGLLPMPEPPNLDNPRDDLRGQKEMLKIQMEIAGVKNNRVAQSQPVTAGKITNCASSPPQPPLSPACPQCGSVCTWKIGRNLIHCNSCGRDEGTPEVMRHYTRFDFYDGFGRR